MARIAGINIPMNKHVNIGLTHIYGIGPARALAICEGSGIAPTTKVKDLTETEVAAIRSYIAKWPIEGDLRREVSMNMAGAPAPQGTAGTRTAHPHQCPHPQGAAQAGGEAERASRKGIRQRPGARVHHPTLRIDTGDHIYG
jgi:ribosomal protein S13